MNLKITSKILLSLGILFGSSQLMAAVQCVGGSYQVQCSNGSSALGCNTSGGGTATNCSGSWRDNLVKSNQTDLASSTLPVQETQPLEKLNTTKSNTKDKSINEKGIK